MRRITAAVLCGSLILPAHAMRMDDFQSSEQTRTPETRQGEQNWLTNELVKRAGTPGADGYSPMGRWLTEMTAAGVLLTVAATNAVGQSLLTGFMNSPDRDDKDSRTEKGIAYLPSSEKIGVMAAFRAGEFRGMIGLPDSKNVHTPLATIVNDGEPAGGSEEELKALVGATAGVILKSPDRQDIPLRDGKGTTGTIISSPGLGMGVVTQPDGKAVGLVRGKDLTGTEKVASLASGLVGGRLLGIGHNDPPFTMLPLDPKYFDGIAPDTGLPQKDFTRIEALGASFKVESSSFAPLDGMPAGVNRQVTNYKSFDQWRAEHPEKPAVEKVTFAEAYNQKGQGLLDNAIAKPISSVGGMVWTAIKTVFGAVATVGAVVANVVTLGQWGAGRRMLAGSAEFTWDALKETAWRAVGLPAGAAGWVLSFSPKGGAVRNLSERLDNWSMRGDFLPNEEMVNTFFQSKDGATHLLGEGIGCNGGKSYKGDGGKVLTFQQKEELELNTFIVNNPGSMTLEEMARMKEVVSKTDIVAVYTGNHVTDMLLMCFELGGLRVASRKVMEPYLGHEYDSADYHSAAGVIGKQYHDQIPSNNTVFIGSAGMHDGWYKDIQSEKVQNTCDIVPNLGPSTTGDRIGVNFTLRFGGPKNENGGIIERKAVGASNPHWWKVWQELDNHNSVDYYIQDQLNRLRNPPPQPKGISVKDPNFAQKLEEKVRRLGQ